MTKIARYVIVLDRYDDDDYGKEECGYGHDGSNKAAIEQVAGELQEAMNVSGALAGFFEVVAREVCSVPNDRAVSLGDVPKDVLRRDVARIVQAYKEN